MFTFGQVDRKSSTKDVLFPGLTILGTNVCMFCSTRVHFCNIVVPYDEKWLGKVGKTKHLSSKSVFSRTRTRVADNTEVYVLCSM